MKIPFSLWLSSRPRKYLIRPTSVYDSGFGHCDPIPNLWRGYGTESSCSKDSSMSHQEICYVSDCHLPQFTLEELRGSILSHEDRLNQEEKTLTNAFNTQDSLNRG